MVAALSEGTFFLEDCAPMEGSRVHIVVVDDEAQITDLIQLFIEASGREAGVKTFNDSRMALEYLKGGHDIDVLITDYKMPFVNGIELLEIAPSHAKKILISGYVSEIAEERLERLRAVFFEKPVPMQELNKTIFEG
jgi:DNA-binding NtrC family response regulator